MIVPSSFQPAGWLPGPHAQTLWAGVIRRRPRVGLRRERVELPDGDFVDLDWTTGDGGPIVLIVHGLEGSSRSRYAAGLLAAVHARRWRGTVLHLRGCSGEPNRRPQRYHACATEDLEYVFDQLRAREPHTLIAVIGYSLGGSIVLNWLSDREEPPAVGAAVAVSVPFDLNLSADRLASGFSRLYQHALLNNLYDRVKQKRRVVPHPLGERLTHRPKNFREFDDLYTAPLHGFAGVDDYYGRCSTIGKLQRIRTRTLILHAADDPFLGPVGVPRQDQLSDAVTLELSPQGGHAAFVSGPFWRPRYWLEQRIPEYIEDRLHGAA